MKVSKWLMVVLTVCLLGGRAFSQSADDIINKNLAALGGKDKLATWNSLYTESSNQVMGQDLPAKTWISNGLGLHSEMEMMGAKMVVVVNKDKGWIVSPLTGNTDVQPLPDEAIKSYAYQMSLAGQFFNYAAKGYTATLLGSEKVDNNNTYKIKMTKSGTIDVIYFVDANTYYIDKVSITVNANGQDIQTELVYSNYQKTPEGFIFPFAYHMGLPQGGDLNVTITKVVINQPIDAKVFEKP